MQLQMLGGSLVEISPRELLPRCEFMERTSFVRRQGCGEMDERTVFIRRGLPQISPERCSCAAALGFLEPTPRSMRLLAWEASRARTEC